MFTVCKETAIYNVLFTTDRRYQQLRYSGMDWQSSTGEQKTAELPTANVGLASTPGTQREVKTSLASTARERCPVCGAATAADQRYCVECGQRLGSARPLFMQGEGSLTRPGGSPAAPPPRRPRFRMSPNSTLIAGIGTLLLAMGVGVLIGRSGQSSNSNRSGAPLLYTAPSGASTTPTTAQSTTSTGAKSSTAGKSTTPGSAKAAISPSKTATPPPNPTVTVGAKGSGPGYQHHKFTGHFFGSENEEEAGEEAEASKGSKSPTSASKGKK
jgi:hypothetical protein